VNYKEVNERNKARLQGEAGVYRVASELLLRGFNPLVPSVDCGADLVVEGGVRIQVKSGHLRYNSRIYPQGAYWFKLTRGPYASGNHTLVKRGPRQFSQESDFVVFWGIEQHRFWITPAHLLDGKSLLIVGPDVNNCRVVGDEVRELFAKGLSAEEIAQRFNCSTQTVERRIKGVSVEPKSIMLTNQVRQCEGKWELIEAMVNSLCEITPQSDSSLRKELA
jgi:hypothetical protein